MTDNIIISVFLHLSEAWTLQIWESPEIAI